MKAPPDSPVPLPPPAVAAAQNGIDWHAMEWIATPLDTIALDTTAIHSIWSGMDTIGIRYQSSPPLEAAS